MTLDEARELVRKIWNFAGLRDQMRPVVTVTTARKGAIANGSWSIDFGPNTLRRWAVIHEVSHCIINARSLFTENHGRLQSHGPEWLSVYIRLLERFGRTGYTGLRRSAKSHGLRVSPKEEAECRFLAKFPPASSFKVRKTKEEAAGQ